MINMINKEALVKKIEILPPYLLQEVADYIDFIKYKNAIKENETILLSEKSLAKEWLKPEEDETWANL